MNNLYITDLKENPNLEKKKWEKPSLDIIGKAEIESGNTNGPEASNGAFS